MSCDTSGLELNENTKAKGLIGRMLNYPSHWGTLSAEKELVEEKKSSKKHQRQPILDGSLPNKSVAVSLFIRAIRCLSLAYKHILERPNYQSV